MKEYRLWAQSQIQHAVDWERLVFGSLAARRAAAGGVTELFQAPPADAQGTLDMEADVSPASVFISRSESLTIGPGTCEVAGGCHPRSC